LTYTRHLDVIERYNDANWVTDSHSVKSTTIYIFMFGGATVSWKSCKQTMIVKRTMESDLITLDTTCLKVVWLKDLLFEFYIMPIPILSISVHTNSRSTIEFLKQENTNKKMNRHIQIRLKSIQCLLDKLVILNFVKSEKNLVDPLTKGLSRSMALESSRR